MTENAEGKRIRNLTLWAIVQKVTVEFFAFLPLSLSLAIISFYLSNNNT
jgi:hypothetical protein